MKTITLTQPWATLMAARSKSVETRGWRPNQLKPGQWVAIHAGKGLGNLDDFSFARLCLSEPFRPALRQAMEAGLTTRRHPGSDPLPSDLPRGAIVAVARFERAIQTQYVTGISAEERAFGNYEFGRWAWVFDQISPVWPPIPAKGALYLWDWTPPAGLLESLGMGAAPARAAQLSLFGSGDGGKGSA